jgi:hypothetical protein
MGQLSFAADKPAIVASQGENVVSFNTRRRASRAWLAPDAQPRFSEGTVVPLRLANRASRLRVSHTELTTGRTEVSDSSETRFTPLDFVATAFLILSVFSAPALVWTLLRSASFG